MIAVWKSDLLTDLNLSNLKAWAKSTDTEEHKKGGEEA